MSFRSLRCTLIFSMWRRRRRRRRQSWHEGGRLRLSLTSSVSKTIIARSSVPATRLQCEMKQSYLGGRHSWVRVWREWVRGSLDHARGLESYFLGPAVSAIDLRRQAAPPTESWYLGNPLLATEWSEVLTCPAH